MDDAELIRRIQQGELEYLDTLIKQHYESIGKYCYWKIGNSEAAQDITQETFYRFFRYFDRYTHVGKCRAYLYTIARNLCCEYFSGSRPLSLEEVREESGQALSMEEGVESEQNVYQMLKVLPTDQHEILLLRFIHNMKYREISDITGLGVCIVQYKVKRGLNLIKKELERRGDREETKVKPDTKPSAATPYAPL